MGCTLWCYPTGQSTKSGNATGGSSPAEFTRVHECWNAETSKIEQQEPLFVTYYRTKRAPGRESFCARTTRLRG